LGSGRPRAAGKPSKTMGGFAPPHLFGRYPGRPGPPRPPKSTISGRSTNHILKAQVCVRGWGSSRGAQVGGQPSGAQIGGTSRGHTSGALGRGARWAHQPGAQVGGSGSAGRRHRGGPGAPVWLPEGRLAGFLGCRETALELVSGADFSWKLMCGADPGDLGGARGSISAGNPGKPENFQPDCLHVPSQSVAQSRGPRSVARVGGRGRKHKSGTQVGGKSEAWVPEGSLAGEFRPGFPGI